MRETGPGRRWIERKGKAFTLKTYAPTGADDYGDPTSEGETSVSVKAVISPRTQTDPLTVTIAGREADIQAVAFVKDSVVLTSGAPPVLQDSTESFEVVWVDPYPRRGTQRLLLSRRTEQEA
jgi:hypothetical protein